MRVQPVLVHLDRERPDQAQAASGVGKDADDVGPPLDLLVQAFQQVGRLQGSTSTIAWRRPASSDTTNSTPESPRSRRPAGSPASSSGSPVGEFDRKNAAPAVPTDADRQQHRLAADHALFAHALVARVDDQIRAGLV
jgi:hypothetical protein